MEPQPIRVERTAEGARFTLELTATTVERQRKTAAFGRFELHSDEPAQVGGDDSAPPPLAYLASALAF